MYESLISRFLSCRLGRFLSYQVFVGLCLEDILCIIVCSNDIAKSFQRSPVAHVRIANFDIDHDE